MEGPEMNGLKETRVNITFSWRDWIALAVSIACGGLFVAIFGWQNLFRYLYMPGLGILLFTVLLLGTACLYLGKSARYDAVSIMLLTAAVLLAGTGAFFYAPGLCVINCFGVLFTGAAAIFRISGKASRCMDDALVILETVSLTFKAIFLKFGRPFKALAGLKGNGRKTALGVIIGIAAAIPLLIIVITLMSSADAVFGGIFTGIVQWLESLDFGTAAWRALRAVIYGLLIFSALSFIKEKTAIAGKAGKSRGEVQSAPFIIVLGLLDAVYAIFVFIQLRFLFGGAETAAMSGGYAQYARSGFFQLVAVAAINLAAVLATASMRIGRGEKIVKILAASLMVMTSVILASAVFRMCLYIGEYGMSMLRIMTLWAMAMIFVGMTAAGIKLIRPEVRFFPVFFAAVLSTWITFNYVDPAARIADWNVNAYLAGQLNTIDTVYLSELGPDCLPALERLNKAEPGRADDAIGLLTENSEAVTWREWNLAWQIVKGK